MTLNPGSRSLTYEKVGLGQPGRSETHVIIPNATENSHTHTCAHARSVPALWASTHPWAHSPMLYFCCTSRTTWVLADLRKIPSVVRAGKQWGLVSLRALGQRADSPPILCLGVLVRVSVGAGARGTLPSPAQRLPEGRGLPGTHRGPVGRQRSPAARAEWAPALGSSPGGCGHNAVTGLQSSWSPGASPTHLSHTHCCKETPNCWLGRGGRGGMGLGAVAGLFWVDLRKSSYLGKQRGGSGPLPGSAVTMATLFFRHLLCYLTWITSFSPPTNPALHRSEDFKEIQLQSFSVTDTGSGLALSDPMCCPLLITSASPVYPGTVEAASPLGRHILPPQT